MRDIELKAWLDCVGRLNAEQRQQLRQRLDAASSLDEVDAALQRRRDKHPQCPRCQSPRVVRNGHADGRQRYKCRACTRSFNALTCTPLARLRHRDRWLAQAEVLVSGLSARQATQQLRNQRGSSALPA